MTYRQNLKKIAEEMARLDESAFFEVYDRLGPSDKLIDAFERTIERYMEFAKVAIRLQGDAFDKGYDCGRVGDVWENNIKLTRVEMKFGRGLIPDL